MRRSNNKSSCPINRTLERFGDAWSLLIVRDLMLWGKDTYGEYLESGEQISPSVLADRLERLEEAGILASRPSPDDKRKVIYSLTERGIDLVPLIYELANWGVHHTEDPRIPESCLDALNRDRDEVLNAWRRALEAGSSFLNGPRSVVEQLDL